MASYDGTYVKYVYLIERSGRWYVAGKYRDPESGSLRTFQKTTGLVVKEHTKRKANAMMPEIAENLDRDLREKASALGGTEDDGPRCPTLEEYIDKFLAAKKLGGLASSSYIVYERICRNVFASQFGDTKLCDISKADVEQALIEARKKLSVDTVKLYLSVINGVMDMAVDDEIIAKNPVAKVTVQDGDGTKPKEVFTEDQLKTFLLKMKDRGEPYLSAVVLGGLYAMRRGEILGLRWEDIDFDHKEINIRHTVTEVNGHVIELERAKSKHSIRTLAMLDVTVDYFKELRQTQLDHGLELDKVCRHLDGRYVKPSFLSTYIPRLMVRYGLPRIRLHDLRATALTLLARIPGVGIKQVAAFAGHASSSVTLEHYIRLAKEDVVNTSVAFENFLTGEC